jgi:hypothetical protein
MSETPRDPKDDPVVQEYFAYLDRQAKLLDWIYGSLIAGGFLAMIVAGIMWFRELITR